MRVCDEVLNYLTFAGVTVLPDVIRSLLGYSGSPWGWIIEWSLLLCVCGGWDLWLGGWRNGIGQLRLCETGQF